MFLKVNPVFCTSQDEILSAHYCNLHNCMYRCIVGTSIIILRLLKSSNEYFSKINVNSLQQLFWTLLTLFGL